MTDRRQFLKRAGATALSVSLPSTIRASARRLSKRRVPGTGEQLAVVGLGNSQAFRTGDAEVSKQLLATFFEHGGGYVDCSGNGALLVASLAGTLGFREAWQSGLAVGVPGTVALYKLAHDDHGALPWRRAFEPAIDLARRGFVVSPRLAGFLPRIARFARGPRDEVAAV